MRSWTDSAARRFIGLGGLGLRGASAAALAVALLLATAAVAWAIKSADFERHTVCVRCHADLHAQWSQSMHSKAYSDPVYRAVLKEARKKGGPAVGRFCLKCHVPIGTVSGEIDPPDGSRLSAIAKDGVQCDFCHTAGRARGKLGNASFKSFPGPVKRGPFKDASSPYHKTAFSKIHTSSEFCGMCHDVFHPTNGLQLEATYTEWKKGPYAKEGIQCQDCHMTPGPGVTKPNPGYAAAFGVTRSHVWTMDFIGGNAMLGPRAASVGVLKYAARVDVAVPAGIVKPGERAQVSVGVRNVGAGHYLPTGLTEVRQMWLEVRAKDERGRSVFKGERRFGTILEDAKGRHGHDVQVWDAVRVFKDDRIPPRQSVTQSYSFTIPKGAKGDVSVVARLKYASFPQKLADAAGVGKVLVVPMAEAQASISTSGSKAGESSGGVRPAVYWAIGAGVTALFALVMWPVFRRRGAG